MDLAGDSGEDPKPFPACAACRCQRIMCLPDCVLAPYFPAGSEADFARVDKLFGAQKITDMIKTLHPDLRRTVAESAVYEARAHVDCPPGGPLCVAKALIAEILRCKSELRCVNKKLQSALAARAAATMPFQELQDASSSVGQNLQEIVLRGGEESAPMIEAVEALPSPSSTDQKVLWRVVKESGPKIERLEAVEIALLCSEESSKPLVEDESAMEAVREMTSSCSRSFSLQQAISELHDLIAQQEEEEELLADCKTNSD
uniref:Lateral organ boundaries domain protein n=1 Tax=Boehmeria nivea TaxID=83906 RepID=A0A172J1W4_BOENI|nr:lateral organ boundaries domain protein [Boehmeria nivea]